MSSAPPSHLASPIASPALTSTFSLTTPAEANNKLSPKSIIIRPSSSTVPTSPAETPVSRPTISIKPKSSLTIVRKDSEALAAPPTAATTTTPLNNQPSSPIKTSTPTPEQQPPNIMIIMHEDEREKEREKEKAQEKSAGELPPEVIDRRSSLSVFSAASSSVVSAGQVPCAVCDSAPATTICHDCSSRMCAACNRQLHSTQKMREHQREPLTGTRPSTGQPLSARRNRDSMEGGEDRCDQCHDRPPVVFCVDCLLSFCEGDAGCNKRVHKPRTMGRHRQVAVEQRDAMIEQLKAEHGDDYAQVLHGKTPNGSGRSSPISTSPATSRRSSLTHPLSSLPAAGGSSSSSSPLALLHRPSLASHSSRTASSLSILHGNVERVESRCERTESPMQATRQKHTSIVDHTAPKSEQAMCDNCDHEVARAFCDDCDMHLCKECRIQMHMPAKFREHAVYLIGPIIRKNSVVNANDMVQQPTDILNVEAQA